MTTHHAPSFLVIRRDNIGDLVCTTPLFHALRERFPHARICALVNSYNRPVLENNPDIDSVYAYTKAKHRQPGQSLFSVYWERLQTIINLRRERFDYAILAASGYEPRALLLARLTRPKHIVGFIPAAGAPDPRIDLATPHAQPRPPHEAQDVFQVLTPLGITQEPGRLFVYPSATLQLNARGLIIKAGEVGRNIIGVHISARKPSQQWPAQHFVQLIQELHSRHQARVVLFWSPGSKSNRLHPGDDEKAATILEQLGSSNIVGFPTHNLGELIAGLSLCDTVICSDGGAMHLAAGLGKPILCFFGKSSLTHWHPWKVPYVALQPASEEVPDISVANALDGLDTLWRKVDAADAVNSENPTPQ